MTFGSRWWFHSPSIFPESIDVIREERKRQRMKAQSMRTTNQEKRRRVSESPSKGQTTQHTFEQTNHKTRINSVSPKISLSRNPNAQHKNHVPERRRYRACAYNSLCTSPWTWTVHGTQGQATPLQQELAVPGDRGARIPKAQKGCRTPWTQGPGQPQLAISGSQEVNVSVMTCLDEESEGGC